MMRIEQTTPEAEILRAMKGAYESVMLESVRRLAYIGETCSNMACEKGNYTNRTGNLRSSVGYVIVYDGEVVLESGFKQVKNGTPGVDAGMKYADQVVRGLVRKGLVLVMVAGMRYASYVSKTKDVLDSAELIAEGLIRKLV